jgi:hypothetical protein
MFKNELIRAAIKPSKEGSLEKRSHVVLINRLMRIYYAFVMFICVSAVGAEPVVSPSPTVTASAAPAAAITQSVTELSAQRAAAERSKIYHAGAAYGRWLDQVAKNSGNAFLQQAVFDRVTWMRLLSSVVALALLFLLGGWFVSIIRRRAGEIESTQYQSWLALSAVAIRKPVALFLWMCGGSFARCCLLPLASLIGPRAFFGPARSPRFSMPDGLSRCCGWYFARSVRSKNGCASGQNERAAY